MKIGVVGLGAVGEACAHALVSSDTARRLVLLNRTAIYADAVARDLRQARAWGRCLSTRVGRLCDTTLLVGCDLVVLTVGKRLKNEEDRADATRPTAELYQSTGLVAGLQRLFEKAEPVVLVVSNPVEIITTWLQRRTGASWRQLFGLGTTVESARFSMHLGRRLGVDARSAWADVLGEHGPGLVMANSGRLQALTEAAVLDDLVNKVLKNTKADARVIRATAQSVGAGRADAICKEVERRLGARASEEDVQATLGWLRSTLSDRLAPGATRFAIAAAVVEVARAVAGNQQRVMTVSSLPPAHLGLPPVALALPFTIGKGGLGKCLLSRPLEGLRPIADGIARDVATIEGA